VESWALDGDDSRVIVSAASEGALDLCPPSGGACERLPFEAGWTAHTLTAGDLDGDGREDLVMGGIANNQTGERSPPLVCLGAQTADAVRCEPLPYGGDRDSGVTVGDLDGDGDQDIVVGVNDTDTWAGLPWICLNDGAGGFSCEAWDAIPEDIYVNTLVFKTPMGDLNGDGLVDVIVSWSPDYVPPLIWCEGVAGVPPSGLCRQTPIHTIQPPQSYHEAEGEYLDCSPLDLELVDLDLDGDLDLAAIGRFGVVYTCDNDGAGDLACSERARLEGDLHGYEGLDVADLDGDRRPDLATFGELEDALFPLICLNREDGFDCLEPELDDDWYGMELLPAAFGP